MNRLALSISLAGLVAFAAPVGAQGRGRNTNGVPPGQRPPAGMCRIWIDGVPAGQQPAPTDCAAAVRNRPSNGRVIFGDESAAPGRGFRGNGDKQKDKHAENSQRDDHDDGARNDNNDGDRNNNDDGDRDHETRRSTAPYPAQLPAMSGAVVAGRGQRTAEITSWGLGAATPRLFDANRDGTPERVHWMSPSGELVQVWSDVNRDGRADRVEIYEAGRRVNTINKPSRP